MAHIVLVFAEAETARALVAGVPTAARALREVALAAQLCPNINRCVIAVDGGWQPDHWEGAELSRLANGLAFEVADLSGAQEAPLLIVSGEQILPSSALAAAVAEPANHHAALFQTMADAIGALGSVPLDDRLTALQIKGRAIVKATGKVGDGPVSRWLNRPMSQALSRAFLRIRGFTPFMATCGTVAIAVAMALSLVFGGETGLIMGGLLFHAASVFDGVDGEVARATFRSSPEGARLDSLTDAATNVAFVAGLSINLGLQGHHRVAIAGLLAVTLLGTGLFLLGQRAKARGANYGFNAVKDKFNARQSWMLTFIAQIAARDFFAFLFALGAVVGVADEGLWLFSFGACVWFVVITISLIRTRSDIGR